MAQKGCKKSPQEVQVYFIRLVQTVLKKMEKVVKTAMKNWKKL